MRSVAYWPALQLTVVLLCVLFFQGCENRRIQLTTGPLIPFAEIDYDEQTPLASQVSFFSWVGLLFNVAGLAVLLLWLPQYFTSLRYVGSLREAQWALILVALLFNSILYFGWLWTNAVFWPTSYLCDAIAWLVGDPATTIGQRVIIACASRLYFLFCWLALALGFVLAKWCARRYVFIDPNRWWQFNLRSWLVATLVLGTGLGMLLRMWQ